MIPPSAPVTERPPSPYLRPAVHAAMGLNALWLGVLPRWGGAALALAAFALNAWVLPRLAIGRALTRPGERFWGGLRTYPLAVLGLVLLLPPAEAAAAWGVLAFGDAAAAVVGRAVPAPRLFGHTKATWSGTPAFVVAGTLAAWLLAGGVVALAAHAPWVEAGAAPSLARAAAAATVAAFVDLVRIPPDDNLPCAAASGLTLHALRGLV